MTGGKEQDESPGQPQESPYTFASSQRVVFPKTTALGLPQCFFLPLYFLCSISLTKHKNKFTTPGGRFREEKVQNIREECTNPRTHFPVIQLCMTQFSS